MVQLELDKYAETHAVLADYYTARRGAELKEEGPEVAAPPDVLGEESPLPVPAADGEDTPTWLKDAIELTPTLAAAVSAALEYFKSVSPPEPAPRLLVGCVSVSSPTEAVLILLEGCLSLSSHP